MLRHFLPLFAGVGGTVTFMVVAVVLGFVGVVVLSELEMAKRELFKQLVVLQQAREQLLRVAFPQDIPHETLQVIE